MTGTVTSFDAQDHRYDFDTKQVLTVKYFKCQVLLVSSSKTTQNAYC
jgi:hypothetical protein